jgi:DNA-binding transcriptional MerR regulator
MAETHASIGEVLSLLREEFPDITISKIRFLESQGLIQPERTPSGYRKFYESDIDRLRWVLRQQRDHFLPLKVIKAKLDAGEVDRPEDPPLQPNLFGEAPTTTRTSRGPFRAASVPDPSQEPTDPGRGAAWLAALQETPEELRGRERTPAPAPLEPLDDSSQWNLEDAAEECGTSVEVLEELIEFGLVHCGSFAGERAIDEAGLGVLRAAVALIGRGVEPRHLRGYKLAAEREVALFEQLAFSLLRQRNPRARHEASELLAELTGEGELLRRALLRQLLRNHLA